MKKHSRKRVTGAKDPARATFVALSKALADKRAKAAVKKASSWPYFDVLREDLANLIEYLAARGTYVTLEQAYVLAVGAASHMKKIK